MAMHTVADYHTNVGIKTVPFSPYDDNGGSLIAIAGDDFALLASDTRLSTGFSIYTREQSKLFRLSDTTVLGCAGCWCDALTLARILEARMQMYLHEHQRPMSTPAVAQMLSTLLYYKRFFPYYVANLLAGLDEEGKGCVYSYDPVGSYDRVQYKASGSAGALLLPFLDNQIGYNNMENVTPEPVNIPKAKQILKDAFISAAERDIYTGDSLYISIITKDGIQEEKFALRRD